MDKISKIALGAVILLGITLRIWGIGFGLPYQFHQDEPIVVNHALAYGTGDFNPHFFIIPPLTSYILFFFYALYYLLLSVLGIVKSAEAFALSFFKDPTPFYIIGRFFIAFIPSILNVYLTYRLAKRFFSEKTVLYASLVMSVAFINVINGHYLYTDNLLVMFILLAYLSMAEIVYRSDTKYYALSALFIGMAIATKYNAIILFSACIAAHLIRTYKRGIKSIIDPRLILLVAVVFATFIICNPFSVLDWKFFVMSVMGRIRQAYVGWSHHIAYSLFEGIGISAAMLGAAGLFAVLKKDMKKGIFLMSFPAVFYLHLVYKSQPFPRYVLPLIPFLAIGAGYILYEFIHGNAKYRILKSLVLPLSLVILIPTFIKSIAADALFTRTDTRAEAAEWIRKNIAPKTKIALDHLFFTPPLKQTVEQMEEKNVIISKQPELKDLKSKKINLQIRAMRGEPTYETYYIVEGGEDIGQFLGFWPVVKNDIESIKADGIEYIIINNMTMSEGVRGFHEILKGKFEPVISFSPYKTGLFRRSYDEVETTGMPVDGKELFSRDRPGPHITIYRMK